MTSCPDKPTASVMGWLCLGLALLGQACSGPGPAPDRSVLPRHEERERFVRLEARLGDPLWEGVTQFSHPLRLSPAEWADRKSTRLNSSHITISYAVFCL